jgi:hypothetical protein
MARVLNPWAPALLAEPVGMRLQVWVGGGGEIPEKFHAYMDSWLELSIPHTETLLHVCAGY